MKRRVIAMMLAALLAAPLHAQPAAPQPPDEPQPSERQRYTPGAFNVIEITGSSDIRFEQGSIDEVVLEGDEDLHDSVRLRLRNGVLRIDSSGGWKFWSSRRLQVTVRARRLTRLSISGRARVEAPSPVHTPHLAIHISGAGAARFDQLQVDRLQFSASGSGDADIAGQAQDLSVNISGRGDFRGENLMSRRARVSISGLGDVKVWATEDLDASVSGVGRIEYWGEPRLRRSSSGAATMMDKGPKAAAP
jgi:hypothetical protein